MCISESDNNLPPIVFIHGWKASILVSKTTGKVAFDYTIDRLLGVTPGDVLSLPCKWDSSDGGRQVKDDLEASHPTYYAKCLCGTLTLAKLYGPMLEHLRRDKGRDVIEFAYDWRRELGETSQNFETFLEQVTNDTGKLPQVIAHSMGCLVTLHVLNRNPKLFHSVLFGAGAMAPNFSCMEDLSLVGRMNRVIKNEKMFTPSQHITNPSAFHFLVYPEERQKFGKEHIVMIEDAIGQPVNMNLHSIDTWRKHKLGMYNPSSGVEVTPDKEKWLASVLERCLKFRKGLIPKFTETEYPPVGVLNSDGHETKFKFYLDMDGFIDFDKVSTLPGDGRIMYEDSLPPKGIPVTHKITNKREHSDVLNDLEAVDELLAHLISSKSQK